MRQRDDVERLRWILDDEGLSCLHKQSGKHLKEWIEENRDTIDGVIKNIESGKKSKHYLRYG